MSRQDNALFVVLHSPMYIDFIQIIMSYRELWRPLRRGPQRYCPKKPLSSHSFLVSAISTNFCIFLSDLYQPLVVLLTRTENHDIFIFGGYFLHSNNPHVLAFYTVDTCIST